MIKRHFHRRNLPHLYYNEGIYFVTYRLSGSISQNALKKLHHKMNKLSPEEQKRVFLEYDKLLDENSVKLNFLSIPEIAEICKQSIRFFDGKAIRVICYCIMPTHIHLVFELISNEKSVGDIMASIKKYSARKANEFLKRKGTFWQSESFDRLIRDERELYFVIKYVLLNPVSAGLVANYKSWLNTYCLPDFEVI